MYVINLILIHLFVLLFMEDFRWLNSDDRLLEFADLSSEQQGVRVENDTSKRGFRPRFRALGVG